MPPQEKKLKTPDSKSVTEKRFDKTPGTPDSDTVSSLSDSSNSFSSSFSSFSQSSWSLFTSAFRRAPQVSPASSFDFVDIDKPFDVDIFDMPACNDSARPYSELWDLDIEKPPYKQCYPSLSKDKNEAPWFHTFLMSNYYLSTVRKYILLILDNMASTDAADEKCYRHNRNIIMQMAEESHTIKAMPFESIKEVDQYDKRMRKIAQQFNPPLLNFSETDRDIIPKIAKQGRKSYILAMMYGVYLYGNVATYFEKFEQDSKSNPIEAEWMGIRRAKFLLAYEQLAESIGANYDPSGQHPQELTRLDQAALLRERRIIRLVNRENSAAAPEIASRALWVLKKRSLHCLNLMIGNMQTSFLTKTVKEKNKRIMDLLYALDPANFDLVSNHEDKRYFNELCESFAFTNTTVATYFHDAICINDKMKFMELRHTLRTLIKEQKIALENSSEQAILNEELALNETVLQIQPDSNHEQVSVIVEPVDNDPDRVYDYHQDFDDSDDDNERQNQHQDLSDNQSRDSSIRNSRVNSPQSYHDDSDVSSLGSDSSDEDFSHHPDRVYDYRQHSDDSDDDNERKSPLQELSSPQRSNSIRSIISNISDSPVISSPKLQVRANQKTWHDYLDINSLESDSSDEEYDTKYEDQFTQLTKEVQKKQKNTGVSSTNPNRVFSHGSNGKANNTKEDVVRPSSPIR